MADAVPALSHAATAECAVAAPAAFALLCDGAQIGRWALGAWATEPRGDGLYVGRSLFDGSETWIRPVPDRARLLIDYHVGSGPATLVPRIMARVMPGPQVGRGGGVCLVTLLAWRDGGMSAERRQRLVACHAPASLLLQAMRGGSAP